MKGVILAGGLGTRLRPITLEIPKPLLPVKRKPIVQYLVELFDKHSITEIFVLANENDIPLFEKWNRDYHNPTVQIVPENGRLGTWGGLKKYLAEKLDDTFVVSNSDELKTVDIAKAVEFHKQSKALSTIATVEIENPQDYGVLVSSPAGLVSEFHYKPMNPPSRHIMSGLYVAEPELLSISHDLKTVSFEEQVIPELICQKRLYEFRTNGKWYDCGTFERYEKAIIEWPNGDY